MMEDELSLSYKKLSFLVKQMPESSKLNKIIFEHNLIDPYKEVLGKTDYIETELPKRVQKRRKESISKLDYLLLLTDLMKRLVKESEKAQPQHFLRFLRLIKVWSLNYVILSGLSNKVSRLSISKKNNNLLDNILSNSKASLKLFSTKN